MRPVALLACASLALTSAAPTLAAAPAPAEPLDFKPSYVSYLGAASGPNDARAVAILRGGKAVAVAGDFAPSGKARAFLAAKADSAGRVMLLTPEGKTLAQAALGGHIWDMESDGADNLAVAGDFGVAVLTPGLAKVLWSAALPGAPASPTDDDPVRVAIGADGRVAALAGKTVTTYSKDGKLLATAKIGRSYVTDVAVVGDRVLVTGFDNKRNGQPVQVAVLEARKHADLSWIGRLWGFDAKGLSADMADTRLYRVSRGADGLAYVAGESAGGNTIFRWDGKGVKKAALLTGDAYHHAYNTASAHIGYLAAVDAAKLELVRGQLTLARLGASKGKMGNAWRPRAVAADASGMVAGGASACCTAQRDARTVNGQPVSAYRGYEATLLSKSADFSARKAWTPLMASGSAQADGGTVAAVAAQGGLRAAVGRVYGGKLPSTASAARPGIAPSAGQKSPDAFLVVWKE